MVRTTPISIIPPILAAKLLPVFKNDMKKYRFKLACIVQNGKYWNNHDPQYIRKADKLTKLFEVSKELYIDCKLALEK